MKNIKKVLVACEYSGKVREAFRALGHAAYSCDLLPADDDSPYHFQMDIKKAITLGPWDVIIMHPPCTALAVSGNRWYGKGQPKHEERLQSVEWTLDMFELAKQWASIGVCMENPVGVLPVKPTQYVQPYMFGHMEQKKTGLWLHGLPPLKATNNVYDEMMALPLKVRQRMHYLPPTADRWKIRSETFSGIAEAMATQWGSLQAGEFVDSEQLELFIK